MPVPARCECFRPLRRILPRRAKARRFDLTVGIGYGDDIGKALGALREVVANEPRVLPDPAPLVQPSDLGEGGSDAPAPSCRRLVDV